MVLQLPYLNSTSKRQFIPAEGIDMDILKAYLSLPRFGGKVDLRPAVNFEDGTDGFLIKHTVPLGLADIQYLKEQTYELRRGMQERRSTQYFDHLHERWDHHREFLDSEARIRDSNSIFPHTIDRNLPIPFLDLPPSYEDIEGLHARTAQPSMARRPVSCPELNLRLPSSGEFMNEMGDQPLTSARIYEPVVLPELVPHGDIDARDSGRGRSVISPNFLQVTGDAAANSKPKGSRRARARSAVVTGRRVVEQYVNQGLAHRPRQWLGVPRGELLQRSEDSYAVRGYADGLPAWA